MKIVVCGGRKFDNFALIRRTLSRIRPDMVVVGEGKCDELALQWAAWFNVPHRQYLADWKKFGLAAGPIRNREMLETERPDMVVAFPGGKGTADCVNQARARNIPVMMIEVEVA